MTTTSQDPKRFFKITKRPVAADVIIRARATRPQSGETTSGDQTEDIFCHSKVICAKCPFFADALFGGWQESQAAEGQLRVINMPDDDACVIRALLRFWYPRATLQLTKDNFKELSRLADKLDVPALGEKCAAYADETVSSDPLGVLEWADEWEDETLFMYACSLIFWDFPVYKKHDGYQTLPPNLLNLLKTAHSNWLSKCKQTLDDLRLRLRSLRAVHVMVRGASVLHVRWALARLVSRPSLREAEALVDAVDALHHKIPYISSLSTQVFELSWVPVKWSHVERSGVPRW